MHPPTAFSCFPLRAALSYAAGALLLAAGFLNCASAQPSVVEPSAAGLGLSVNGAPFYPLGWSRIGACHPDATDYEPGRRSVLADLEDLRLTGVNMVLEPAATGGRLLPLRLANGWWNWKNYEFFRSDADGEPIRSGQPRPGVYVEALRWLMDHAAAPPAGGMGQPIYVTVVLHPYIKPGYEAEPYDGSEHIGCSAFAETIEEERRQHADDDPTRAVHIPSVPCADAPAELPYWEWTLRYVVHNLRDHPGLFGWLLWDEPEGSAFPNLFGIVEPGEPIRPFTGPESLPTPDLLHYAYRRVIDFETEGRAPDYRRHPVVLDLRAPQTFYSSRFPWSEDGAQDPRYHNGPFDRRPDGSFGTPADVLALEASVQLVHTRAAGRYARFEWYWDQNFQSMAAAMLREAAARDGLWSTFVSAGQAQLPSSGPFAPSPSSPCTGDNKRARVLNDRDLVWGLLTSQINGLRGHLYYARALLPSEGVGGEQRRRSDRLLAQFAEAGLDRIFSARAQPEGEGWRVSDLRITALTDYFRSDPAFTGPADDYDPGLSAFSRPYAFDTPDDYRAGRFGRSSDEDAYGHATPDPRYHIPDPQHRLLRAALFDHDGTRYLFLSNVYDARIETTVTFDGNARDVLAEGRFDLDADGRFAWAPGPQRATLDADAEGARLTLQLEPYEARFFRLTSR